MPKGMTNKKDEYNKRFITDLKAKHMVHAC